MTTTTYDNALDLVPLLLDAIRGGKIGWTHIQFVHDPPRTAYGSDDRRLDGTWSAPIPWTTIHGADFDYGDGTWALLCSMVERAAMEWRRRDNPDARMASHAEGVALMAMGEIVTLCRIGGLHACIVPALEATIGVGWDHVRPMRMVSSEEFSAWSGQS